MMPLVAQHPTLTLPGTGNDLFYTGREYAQETNLYYYRVQYYDAEIGQFISEDPLGFKVGINFYAYVNNNPVNFNDPLGKKVLPILLIAVVLACRHRHL